MPLCRISTNLASRRIPPTFETKFSALIAKILSKPEHKVIVMLHTDMRMCRNGTNDDTIHVAVWSVGVFSKAKNQQYSAPIYSYVNEAIGVPVERIKISFHDLLLEQLPPPPQ